MGGTESHALGTRAAWASKRQSVRAWCDEARNPMTVTQERILVVDDDPMIRELIQEYFSRQGFVVETVGDAAEARARLAVTAPSILFLDVGLPGEDGLSLARHVREQFDIPVIMVSGATDPLDRIVGLEIGADDYVSKPFEPRELLARVKSVLRRYRQGPPVAAGEAPPRLRIPGFELDMHARTVYAADGSEIAMTRMEFDLLQVFVEHPNRVLSRDQLLNFTQNRDWDPFDRSIDIRVARLRRKLESGPQGPDLIRTVRGVGYMFAPGGRPA
jgi:DNA-binding response OmpR family regulator